MLGNFSKESVALVNSPLCASTKGSVFGGKEGKGCLTLSSLARGMPKWEAGLALLGLLSQALGQRKGKLLVLGMVEKTVW